LVYTSAIKKTVTPSFCVRNSADRVARSRMRQRERRRFAASSTQPPPSRDIAGADSKTFDEIRIFRRSCKAPFSVHDKIFLRAPRFKTRLWTADDVVTAL
jgi:hypothetical protein